MRHTLMKITAAAGVLLAVSVTQAQHSYLPATKIGGNGKIETFVNGAPGQVVTNTFSTALAGNIWRAGGPSAFLLNSGDPALPAGFDTLAPNTDLTLTVPSLSHANLNGTGNLLYWDMTGGTPNFGAAPAHTTIAIGREDSGLLTNLATIDGAAVDVSFVEDTSNATGGRSGHFHLRYDVVGDNTDAANEAPNGIYLLGNIVSMAGFTDSELVLIPLLKSGFDPTTQPNEFAGDLAVLNSAADFLANNVVPEPTTGLIIVAAAALFAIPRRRNRGVCEEAARLTNPVSP